jgi:RNA polymerase sigma factor (sigma-70 family)
MTRPDDPQAPQPPRPRLLPSRPPLPAVVPLLRPDQRVTPAQDALLTGLARRAREGDTAARDLLWIAFAPKLEPELLRCTRIVWQHGWVRRDGRPWDLEDVRQEAWRVFAELTAAWSGEGSFSPYAVAYFAWRLRTAVRRLAPRRTVPAHLVPEPVTSWSDLLGLEGGELLVAVIEALTPVDVELLRLRLDGAAFTEIATRLGVSRQTVYRRWQRIKRVAREILSDGVPRGPEDG